MWAKRVEGLVFNVRRGPNLWDLFKKFADFTGFCVFCEIALLSRMIVSPVVVESGQALYCAVINRYE
jgi:hypothetical protein